MKPTGIRFLATLLAPLAALHLFSVSAFALASPPLRRLAADLADHFNAAGDLVLDWQRERPPALTDDAAFQILSYPAALAPQMLVRIRIHPETTSDIPSPLSSAVAADITLILRAQLWRDGWILPAPSVRGDAVLPSVLTIKRFDALRDRDAVAVESDADLIYARAVPAGRLLTWRDVIRRPLVRRGQLIEIAATEGPLSVTLRGIAMEDAGRGEIVRVRNPDSRKEFTALVTAESAARVSF